MYKRFFFATLILLVSICCQAQRVNYSFNPSTGAISRLWIDGESNERNWIVATDGSQYSFVGENYGWGLGYFDISRNGETVRNGWEKPQSVSKDGSKVIYEVSGIEISVSRWTVGKDLYEKYIFTNISDSPISLDSVGIYTPFNDNYPDAGTCMTSREHAHIWTGENASYVEMFNMGAQAPHLGLALVDGSIERYDVWERSRENGMSNARGIFALSPEAKTLSPGQFFAVEWKLFANSGWNDFFSKLVASGSVRVKMDRYTYQKGEKASVEVLGPEKKLKNCTISVDGQQLEVSGKGGSRVAELLMNRIGDVRIDVTYGDGEHTHADCHIVSSIDGIIAKRVQFIEDHQQMNSVADPRYGAYMVYDNEQEKIYLNDTPNSSFGDRCEGAERLGMGVVLADYCLAHPDDELKESLERYADFVRRGLQDADFNTWRSMSHVWGRRVYNYPWIAHFYFLMYRLTGEKKYALDGYGTMKAMYRNFWHSRYPIGQPIRLSLECLAEAGLSAEYDSLLEDYKAVAESYISTSLDFPPHEVNYEQSIIAPSVVFLTEMYLQTMEEKYLDEAKKQMPVLEAFGGKQPSFHLNDISIRHWDGYWFGKREMWGDTMPHYWSCVTALAFHYYSLCTGDEEYQRRAENIVRNNLCLFTEDGRGSCAYIYPDRVNGIAGKFFDPYANDQDWALWYYSEVLSKEE